MRLPKSSPHFRLTRGLQLDLEIALSGVSAKVQPHGFFSPCRRCVETSGDVIESTITSSPESRIWDFSPMRSKRETVSPLLLPRARAVSGLSTQLGLRSAEQRLR